MSAFVLGDAFAGYGFADSVKFTPLQAADLLAYGTHHLIQDLYMPSKYCKPDFPVHRAFWEMLNNLAKSLATEPNGIVCDLETLVGVIEKVKRGDMLPPKSKVAVR